MLALLREKEAEELGLAFHSRASQRLFHLLQALTTHLRLAAAWEQAMALAEAATLRVAHAAVMVAPHMLQLQALTT